jgi:hypothetical protein
MINSDQSRGATDMSFGQERQGEAEVNTWEGESASEDEIV